MEFITRVSLIELMAKYERKIIKLENEFDADYENHYTESLDTYDAEIKALREVIADLDGLVSM